MKEIKVLILILMVVFVQVLLGVTPQKWEFYRIEDFIDGKFDGISVSHEGVLSLAPKEEALESPPEEFYLSLLVTAQGTIFVGTGHSGKIYKKTPDGQPELFYQAPEMDVLCLVQDKAGNLYAGTSPNGRIYKITPEGKGEPFFNPEERYIWDLMFSEEENLLAAVGETAGIYEINQKGEGLKIFEAEENHILCLEKSTDGGLIAGGGGKGVIYKVIPGQKPSILYESSYEEIKSIALDREGNIYAAAGGKVVEARKNATPLVQESPATEITVTATPSTPLAKPLSVSMDKEPGAIYRINPEGLAKELWSSEDELVYSLLWDEGKKKITFGTGDKGRIYEIDAEGKVSLLLQEESEQVYLLFSQGSLIFALANNPPRLSRISLEQRIEGEYQSRVLDAKTLSAWGRITWDAELPAGASMQFLTRSGNSAGPDRTWSDWSPPYLKADGEQILSPKGRYLQYMAKFKAESGKMSPHLKKASLYFLGSNLPPSITKLELLPANEVYLKSPEQDEVIWGEDFSLSEEALSKNKEKGYVSPKKVERKGFQTVIWEAADENDDSLIYSISIRKEDETAWRFLKQKWVDGIIAFDTSSFPDGVYFLKIEASDLPSNPKGTELKAEKISRALVIDNSLPVIRNFQIERRNDRISVSFSAEDALTPIKEAKFLVRPGDWQTIFPEDGICDSRRESFSFSVPLTAESDNLIVVRVNDSYGNTGVYRATF
jgi:hypothetical protein